MYRWRNVVARQQCTKLRLLASLLPYILCLPAYIRAGLLYSQQSQTDIVIDQLAKMVKHEPSRPPHLVDNHSFANASVSFAVDVSGSTLGRTLTEEKRFVAKASSLLSPRSQIMAKILPWDDKAKTVRGLSKLETLQSAGYTVPGAIIENNESRLALKQSSLWFLLTDGLIDDAPRERFAKLIAQNGIHGTSCVVVIFGTSYGGSPASCNISVGVSVFAVVPHCLFLFYDTSNRQIMIFSCKGIFKSLLGDQANPEIDERTTWLSIPRLSIEKLSSLIIPPAKSLSEDEIALQGDMVVNFEELWSNSLTPERVSKILSDEDNVASLVMTAQSRNQVDRYQTWIQQQKINVDDPLFKTRPDIYGNTTSNFQELLASFKAGGLLNGQVQFRLRKAYAMNMSSFLRDIETKEREAQARDIVIQTSSSRSSSCISSAQSLSPTPSYGGSIYSNKSAPTSVPIPPSSYGGSYNPPRQRLPYMSPTFSPVASYSYSTPRQPVSAPQPPPAPRAPPRSIQSDLLYTPGFRKKGGSFTGSCPICGAGNVTMAWLFRTPPTQLTTPGFPALGESSTPAFPLAAGNFPETDIVSASICCDPCSTLCVNVGSSPASETIIGALPMVLYAENTKSYEEALYKALGRRFALEYVAQVFLSILLSSQDVFSDGANAAHEPYVRAIRWTCRDLIKNSTALPELSVSFSLSPQRSQKMPLDWVLSDSFGKINDVSSSIIRYPLDGFAVAMRAAGIANLDAHRRERAMFRRYLYLLIETFRQKQLGHTYIMSLLQANPGHESLLRTMTPETLLTPPAADDLATTANGFGLRTSLPISVLKDTAILDERRYRTLQSLEEFRTLEQNAASWVGPATAIFLYATAVVDASMTPSNPWNLFNAVMNQPGLGAISVKPEDYNADQARKIMLELA